MPSKSKAQARLMAAASHNPAFAKKVGIPTKVAKEFNMADKGRKFKEGGDTMKDDIKQDKAMAKKAVGMHEKQLHGGKKSNLSTLKCGGKVAKYAEGGKVGKVGKSDKAMPEGKDMGPLGLKKGGSCSMKKYAKGGGIEVRGKTKGRMV